MYTEEVRRAAMGRYRWGQLLEANCIQPGPSSPPLLKPASGPITVPSAMTAGLQEKFSADWRFAFQLIPGGRYLALADLRSLKLLDLGAPGKPPLSTPLEVATLELGLVKKRVSGLQCIAWVRSSSISVVVGTMYDSR